MLSLFLKLSLLVLLLFGANEVVVAQPSSFPTDASDSGRSGGSRRSDAPKGFKEMLAKQRAERAKRDHREMLERGEAALRLAEQLEASFANNKTISREDKARLESLEDVVVKIRKELGGGDDGDSSLTLALDTDEPGPSNLEEAFKFLQSSTVKLVDELKKTTRFTISAVAIQSSNNVLKLVKFLRIRK